MPKFTRGLSNAGLGITIVSDSSTASPSQSVLQSLQAAICPAGEIVSYFSGEGKNRFCDAVV
jgi:hypothetical protein